MTKRKVYFNVTERSNPCSNTDEMQRKIQHLANIKRRIPCATLFIGK